MPLACLGSIAALVKALLASKMVFILVERYIFRGSQDLDCSGRRRWCDARGKEQSTYHILKRQSHFGLFKDTGRHVAYDAAASILILQPSRRCIHDVQALVGAVAFPALNMRSSLHDTPLLLDLLLHGPMG